MRAFTPQKSLLSQQPPIKLKTYPLVLESNQQCRKIVSDYITFICAQHKTFFKLHCAHIPSLFLIAMCLDFCTKLLNWTINLAHVGDPVCFDNLPFAAVFLSSSTVCNKVKMKWKWIVLLNVLKGSVINALPQKWRHSLLGSSYLISNTQCFNALVIIKITTWLPFTLPKLKYYGSIAIPVASTLLFVYFYFVVVVNPYEVYTYAR